MMERRVACYGMMVQGINTVGYVCYRVLFIKCVQLVIPIAPDLVDLQDRSGKHFLHFPLSIEPSEQYALV